MKDSSMNSNFSVLPKWVVLLFFWVGLTAGICVRSLTLIGHYSPVAAGWVWRFAMVCYIFFFGYRYLIGRRRMRIVRENKLIAEIEKASSLDPNVQQATLYILKSIVRSKELINYILICILSIIALFLDIFFT
jgi:hypothetical protein